MLQNSCIGSAVSRDVPYERVQSRLLAPSPSSLFLFSLSKSRLSAENTIETHIYRSWSERLSRTIFADLSRRVISDLVISVLIDLLGSSGNKLTNRTARFRDSASCCARFSSDASHANTNSRWNLSLSTWSHYHSPDRRLIGYTRSAVRRKATRAK